jgi:hypothetical protein
MKLGKLVDIDFQIMIERQKLYLLSNYNKFGTILFLKIWLILHLL